MAPAKTAARDTTAEIAFLTRAEGPIEIGSRTQRYLRFLYFDVRESVPRKKLLNRSTSLVRMPLRPDYHFTHCCDRTARRLTE